MSAAPKVLLVEDEAVFASAVKKRLDRRGFAVRIAADLGTARVQYAAENPDILLLDMRLPDGSGLDFLAELTSDRGLKTPVLVMSAYGELEDAVSAMRLGAADYLKKPVDLDELLLNIEGLLRGTALNRRLAYSEKREQHAAEKVEFLGQCPAIQAVRRQLAKIVDLTGGLETVPPTVLILGETGTGKDVLARGLHVASTRSARPFVHVDCAALPKDLIEAELFGHAKGAFTDAHSTHVGLIEAAEDGVLFLDEIGELPMDLQGKLLAVLERRSLRRIGTTQEYPIPAWIIAATNRTVATLMDSGTFRSDLYYRLNVLSVSLPPLRDRGEDIPLLTKHFASLLANRYGLDAVCFTDAAMQQLRQSAWPGNVRELRHLIERTVLLHGGGEIGVDALGLSVGNVPQAPPAVGVPLATAGAGLSLRDTECTLITAALRATGGNLSAAARQLGITRMALRYRTEKYNIDPAEYRRIPS